MSLFCDRVEEGNQPLNGSASMPTAINCGPLGVFYTVLGNLHFNILTALVCLFGPVFYFAAKVDEKNLFALFTSLAIFVLVLLRKFLPYKSDRISLGLNITFVLLLSLTILPFFLAVGPVVRANRRPTYDKYLVAIDRTLLGWLYPDGQMSLALDASSSLNPSTGFGRFYTDLLQIFYVTYYLWGYLTILVLGYRYVKAWRNSDGKTVNLALAQTKLYLCGWLSAFLLVFICNTSLPALSPRLYFKNIYKHRLEGFGLAKLLIGVATDDASYGSFPSGHFGESIISGIYMYRINKPLGIVVIVSSAMIGLATQALRYHYFTDLLGATIVVILSLLFGFNITAKIFHHESYRVAASYVSQTGSVEYNNDEARSFEMTITSENSSDTSMEEDKEVDLEAGLGTDSPAPRNTYVHALI